MGNIIISHPKMTPQAEQERMRASTAAALLDYKRKGLLNHFKRSALSQYGGEFGKLDLRSDPNKLPLVASGKLRSAVQSDPGVMRGGQATRRLVMSGLPRYLYINRGFNKLRALEQLSDKDREQFTKVVDETHAKLVKQG